MSWYIIENNYLYALSQYATHKSHFKYKATIQLYAWLFEFKKLFN